MTDNQRSHLSQSYMQSWDASSVANRAPSSGSSERSPSNPLSQDESPRVRKPLVSTGWLSGETGRLLDKEKNLRRV